MAPWDFMRMNWKWNMSLLLIFESARYRFSLFLFLVDRPHFPTRGKRNSISATLWSVFFLWCLEMAYFRFKALLPHVREGLRSIACVFLVAMDNFATSYRENCYLEDWFLDYIYIVFWIWILPIMPSRNVKDSKQIKGQWGKLGEADEWYRCSEGLMI